MTTYTTAQKIKAIEREIKIRQQVYPGRVATHRMTQQQSDYQIDLMFAILQDYKIIEKKERLI